MDLHEIVDGNDPRLVSFCYLFQTLFPLDEQVPVAEVLEVVQGRRGGGMQNQHLYTLEVEGEVAAMAWLQSPAEGRELPLAMLWYIGVAGHKQGGGLGSRLYRELCRRAFEEYGAAALAMEVERVDVAARHGDQRARQAERRLDFYCRRHGALVLQGVEYVQSTGWQPPVPMHLLVQPASPSLTVEEVVPALQRELADGFRLLPGVRPMLVPLP